MRKLMLSLVVLGGVGAGFGNTVEAAPVQPGAIAPVLQLAELQPVQYGYGGREEFRRRQEFRREQMRRRQARRFYRRY